MRSGWWKPIAHFAGHCITGTVIFIMIGAVAVGLSTLVKFLETHSTVPPFTLLVLTWLEQAILVTDALLFLAHIATSGYRAIMEMKNGDK